MVKPTTQSYHGAPKVNTSSHKTHILRNAFTYQSQNISQRWHQEQEKKKKNKLHNKKTQKQKEKKVLEVFRNHAQLITTLFQKSKPSFLLSDRQKEREILGIKQPTGVSCTVKFSEVQKIGQHKWHDMGHDSVPWDMTVSYGTGLPVSAVLPYPAESLCYWSTLVTKA